MKTISPTLRTHLAQPITTLATCWQIIRTDGEEFAFTAFDDDLVVGGVTYSSIAGFVRTAIQTNSEGQVDNLDLIGFLQEDGITEQDLKNGLFDYASIYVFVVNWANIGQGICRLRRGWLGETTISPAGIFQAELRGLTQALVQEFGSDYMPMCRADLGDAKCMIPIKPPPWSAHQTVKQDYHVQALTQTTDDLKVAIFRAQGDGTTGATEPTWNTPIGDTNADGSVSWISEPFWRGIFVVETAISQRQFIAPLSIPAAPNISSTHASVSFRDNVSTGTEITVSDGTISHSYFWPYDQKGSDAKDAFYNYMIDHTDWGITVTTTSNVVFFDNASGHPGSITKVGDTLRGIVIQDFQAAPFDGGTVTWIDGQNAGRSMEIKSYDTTTGTIILWLQMNYPIEAGDKFFCYPGCDKRRDTCFNTFNNILNFRGEPDMPMVDKLLSYPDA
jgi:hypothetical protein